MQLDNEQIEDFCEMLNNEGHKHFTRNLEESGYSKSEIVEILEKMNDWEEEQQDFLWMQDGEMHEWDEDCE